MSRHLRFGILACVLLAAVPAFAKNNGKLGLSSVKQIVVVMMENRSFDHLLGWHPTADGMQAGLSYIDDSLMSHDTAHLTDFQGCGHPDPDHSWCAGRIDYNGGQMDGFLRGTDCEGDNKRTSVNDEFAIGYYAQEDRPFFNALALNYTTFDQFFSPILAETYPNRIFMHAAQTDRLSNSLFPVVLPTIWDRLADKGVSARYYVSDFSFLLLWGPTKYASISRSYDQFLQDAKSGRLPAVSFVEPRFNGEEEGTSNDDHPHADIRAGDAFLAQTFRAVATGPQWGSTVFIVTYDEWGGFFEHVPPPRAIAPNDTDPDLDANGKALLGMRIPVVVASPFTKGNPATPRVVSTVFDNTSILKLIEKRFGLQPLTLRDASDDIGNLATALNFANADRRLPSLPNPGTPTVVACPQPNASSADREPGMQDLGQLPR